MNKKKIHKLSFEQDGDFSFIGIASHENDYRLSWAINKCLGFDLVKVDDVIVNHTKHKLEIAYSMYSYSDENNYIDYNLISNKSEKGFLIPGMKNIDFVLRISGTPDVELLNEVVKGLKKTDIIITAFILEELPDKIKKMLQF